MGDRPPASGGKRSAWLDTALDYLPGLREVHGVAGAVITTLAKPVSPSSSIRRSRTAISSFFYRFTVAEEFAHLKLHRKLLETVTSLDEVIQLHEWERYPEIDRNAKWLASALLMLSLCAQSDSDWGQFDERP